MRENEAHTEENSSDVKYKRCKNLFYGTGKQIKGTQNLSYTGQAKRKSVEKTEETIRIKYGK